MISRFVENLKLLTEKYTSKQVAHTTDVSLQTLNKYLTGTSEPPVKFLVKLKEAYNINIEEMLFSDLSVFSVKDDIQTNLYRFEGNFVCYYYNNAPYLGSINDDLNEMNYGVLSIKVIGDNCKVYCSFTKTKKVAQTTLERLNSSTTIEEIETIHKETSNHYVGYLKCTAENVFIELSCKEKSDNAFIIFKNPPSKSEYMGGIATINSISRGREHNPCIQYFLICKKFISKPDGEIYNLLSLKGVDVNTSKVAVELLNLIKSLYMKNDGLYSSLKENQKINLIENMLKYHYDNLIEGNQFRYGKISNREDDEFYQLIKGEQNS